MITETLPKPNGRPTKLTPELQEKICRFVAEGNYLTTACQAVGISYQTFLNWSKLGEQEALNDGGMFLDFFEAIKMAEAESEAERVSRIRQAGMGGQVSKRITRQKRDGTEETEETFQLPQWLADITFLERRHRERWGRPAPIQVNVDQSKTVQITHVEYRLPSQATGQVIEGESRELLEGEE